MELTESEITETVYNRWVSQWKTCLNVISEPKIPLPNLCVKQQKIVNLVENHIKQSVEKQGKNPLRLIVHGAPGTGKTEVLTHLQFLLENRKQNCPDFDYLFVALTGSASFLMNGQTIHSAFKIATYKQQNVTSQTLTKKRVSALKNVRIIVCDESSLLGLRLFHKMDTILRQVDSNNSQYTFANCSIILLGDLHQTGPIADYPLFFPMLKHRDKSLRTAYSAYKSFNSAVILDTQFRHDGHDASQMQLKAFLNRLKRMECTNADVIYIRQRMECKLDSTERDTFKTALRIFPLRWQVKDCNRYMLRESFMDSEIVQLSNGLYTLELAIGCPLVLQKNIATRVGLHNGCEGTLIDIIYHSTSSKGSPVYFLVVDFPGYTGNKYVRTARGVGVPIFRSTEPEMQEDKTFVTSDRFPLDLFYATTGHKCQGKTLSKACIFLDENQFCPGMDYVMFSRCKRMNDIMVLDSCITSERILNHSQMKLQQNIQQKEEQRLKALESQMLQ